MVRYQVYILLCSDGSLYTGYTANIVRRLAQHNAGKGAKYTRGRLPVALAFAQRQLGLGQALRREIEIKKMSREAKLELCRGYLGRSYR